VTEEPSAADRKKILIVEDSDTMRHLIHYALLRLPGSEIVEAQDGSEAIKKLRQHEFDLIITDLIMPNIDGYKLIQYIRKQEEYRETPIIIVSTKYSEEARKRGFEVGANAYISKPVHSGTLIETVKKLLGNQSLTKLTDSQHGDS
jgi:two-component system chemotaxis response regulator CheY